jgi:hypothetical protein
MTELEQPEWLKGYEPKPGWTKGMKSPNPTGRPPGSSKQQKFMKRILTEGQAVVDAVLEKAKAGDPASAGLILSRILPTLRAQSQTVEFDFDPELPIGKQVEQVLAAVAAGEVAPDVGQAIVAMITNLASVRATEELEQRIVLLEGKVVN